MPPPQIYGLIASRPISTPPADFLSPLEVEDRLRTRDSGPATTYVPGQSSINPQNFNNVGFFVLFALIGVAFILAAIWFFFWAKNGGFHFRKGDWDDYKSTVLRRKGPDGKTLSNATKSTKLGGGSVVGSEYTDTTYSDLNKYTDAEKGETRTAKDKKKRHHKRGNRYDADVRAYREEKPARVGGINKAPEGTSHDGSTNPNRSQPAMSEVPSRYQTPRSERQDRRNFSYNQGSEASFSAAAEGARSKSTASPNQQYRNNRERRSQGYYAQRASEGSYADPIDFSGSSSRGAPTVKQVQNTKSYQHTIPGLSKGPGRPNSGFRRGGARRDSLSESDGDDTYMS